MLNYLDCLTGWENQQSSEFKQKNNFDLSYPKDISDWIMNQSEM